MWITSLLRACFRSSKPETPDASPANVRSRPYSADEDMPLRSMGHGALSATVSYDESLPGVGEMPPRPSALLMPDAQDIRSPTDGVLRTPLPLTPLTLSSPSLPSGSPTLQILRTPMPFGSPVPYPHSIDGTASPDMEAPVAPPGGPHGMQLANKGIFCLPYTLPFELRQQKLRASGGSLAQRSNPKATGADAAQHSASQAQSKTPFAEHSNALQAQLGEGGSVTPAPFKFKVSSQGQGRTPRVSGIENPATSYKENKAVVPRHTPFAERIDRAVANENAFRASLSGHKRSGLGKAS